MLKQAILDLIVALAAALIIYLAGQVFTAYTWPMPDPAPETPGMGRPYPDTTVQDLS